MIVQTYLIFILNFNQGSGRGHVLHNLLGLLQNIVA